MVLIIIGFKKELLELYTTKRKKKSILKIQIANLCIIVNALKYIEMMTMNSIHCCDKMNYNIEISNYDNYQN